MGIVAGIAAVVSAGAGIVGAVDAKKQADKAYEAQEAAFQDEVTAAITNAEWKLKDNEAQYNIDNRQANSNFQSYVDASWDTFNANADYTRANAMLENVVTKEMTDIELASMKKQTTAELKMLAELSELDAEYAIETASIHNDEVLTKAAIDAVEHASLANSAVQFIDSDIDAMKSSINQIKETADVQTKEAIGQEIMRIANSVTSGNSSARRVMNTYMKADIMASTKIAEQEDAITKAYNTQTRAGKESAARIQSTISRANNAVAANSKQTINKVQNNIASTKINMATKIENLINASETLKANSNVTMNAMTKKADIKAQNLQATLAADINKTTRDFATDKQFRKESMADSQYRTTRGLEQSILTQKATTQGLNKFIDNNNKLLDFYNNNPSYVNLASKRGELQTLNVGDKIKEANTPLAAATLGYTDISSFWNDYSPSGKWEDVKLNLVQDSLDKATEGE